VPGWLESFEAAYDITGKPSARVTDDQCRQMLQILLEDLLTVAKNSPRLQEVVAGAVDLGGVRFNGRRPAVLSEQEPPPGWPMGRLASFLEDLLADDRPLLDRTGLKGIYVQPRLLARWRRSAAVGSRSARPARAPVGVG
jgi:hypothetical protein